MLNGDGAQGSSLNDMTIQDAVFDALGSKIETEADQCGSVKLINSGDLDGTMVYYWDSRQDNGTEVVSGTLSTRGRRLSGE